MNEAKISARRTRRRHSLFVRWSLRLTAILFGLGSFLGLELVCVFAGWGDVEVAGDPFVEFTSVRPLFELTADGQKYFTSVARRGYFKEDSFLARKPAGEFRIFVLGGSTVQGNPFSIETSFPAYLQIALQTAIPQRTWRVVNCGGVSYASYRLYPVMMECLEYEPDMFIFCEGHNEFLEDVSYASVREASEWVRTVLTAFNSFRSFRILRSVVVSLKTKANIARLIDDSEEATKRPRISAEVDTLLDHEGGLEAYHRDDQHALQVVEHFRYNLERMAAMCSARKIPLMMILPPSNLSDCPPFKPEFSEALPDEDRLQIHQLVKTAHACSPGEINRAIELANSAVKLDERYALAWYELGHFQLAARQFADAEFSFRRARDEDICPLRMISALENVMKQVAEERNLPFVNAHELLQEKCANGIVGENVLVDHVHPSFQGHEDIAIAITKWMISSGVATVENNDWIDRARNEYQRRLQSLDNLYFLRGRRTLENLRLWATGRSGGPPLKSALP